MPYRGTHSIATKSACLGTSSGGQRPSGCNVAVQPCFPVNTLNGTNYWVDVVFVPSTITIASVSLNPSSLVGGNSSTGTVTLNSPAQGNVAITLSSDNSVATTPATVTVVNGTTSAPFTVNTSAVTSITQANISAWFNDSAKSAPLTVNPQSASAASVTFLKIDTTTQGNWKASYGADGYNVIGDSTSYPSYASVAPSGQSSWVWASSTADVRGLEKAASTTDGIAAAWYSSSSFGLDVNLSDGKTHQIAVYLLDWDSGSRAETISVADAATGTVLDSHNITSFVNGEYLVWNVSGHVTITVTCTAGPNAVTSGIFFGGTRISSSASFVKTDTTTQGNWKATYGADGYNVIGDTTSYPSYASVAPTGQSSWVWASSTSDIRALEKAASITDRIAATWFASSSFSMDVNLTDGHTHQLALYLLDWDNLARAETITIADVGTGIVLDTRSASSFVNGEYLVWNIAGHVRITVARTGGNNAVISGLFFGGAVPVASSAAFVKTDTTTQGNWKVGYGGDGYNVIGDTTSYPSYASVTPSGQSSYVWAASTSDIRALEKAASITDRIAATWYASSSFSMDVNLTDSNTHQVALYLLDWDNGARAETITIADASTAMVLDTRSASSFGNGEYLVWNIAGHVTITVTRTGGANAVLSGLFFGGPRAVTSSASFVKTDTTTQGNWKGTYGANGYNVIGDSTSYPSYVTVTPAGQSSWVWAASTSDVRALEKASSTTDRIAATWYSSSNFSIDINLSDTNSHQIALYMLDWDSNLRTQTITIADPASGLVLDTRSISSFGNGEYLVWNITGHVTITVTRTGGSNAVVSGIFF